MSRANEVALIKPSNPCSSTSATSKAAQISGGELVQLTIFVRTSESSPAITLSGGREGEKKRFSEKRDSRPEYVLTYVEEM